MPLNPVIACQLNAHTPEQRARHRELLQHIFAHKLKLHEQTHGYIFTFKAELSLALQITEYIMLEHLCCPFLALTLHLEPDLGLQLEIKGSVEAKPLIWSNLQAAMQ